MTDDRSLERAARSWIEVGPTRAPDEAVEAALLRIQSTPQERDWLPWRIPDMSPILRTAVLAVAVLAVGATSIALWGGTGIGGPPAAAPTPTATPSASPSASPSARPSPTPFTGACLLLTSDEAAAIAGDVGLGALPSETLSGEVSSCRFSDGGGNIVLRTTLTTPGGAAAFAMARDTAGVEVIEDLGDAAVYDPAKHTLHVLVGDAAVSIVASRMGASDARRRLDAVEIARLVADRL
jgi:hypothetical protein